MKKYFLVSLSISMKSFLLSISVAIILVACNKDDSNYHERYLGQQNIVIASKVLRGEIMLDALDSKIVTMLLIKTDKSNNWEIYDRSQLRGCEHIEGYEYHLRVKKYKQIFPKGSTIDVLRPRIIDEYPTGATNSDPLEFFEVVSVISQEKKDTEF